GRITGERRWTEAAGEVLRTFGALLARQPFGMAHMLAVLDDEIRGPAEVVIAGALDDPATRALLAAAHATWEPGRETLLLDPAHAESAPEALVGKSTVGGRPAAWVCRGLACAAPVTNPGDLSALLAPA
ncbi:hypothetical protein KGQ64_10060, partial [bacterium]|nr:hypothetical protein [bacterium]